MKARTFAAATATMLIAGVASADLTGLYLENKTDAGAEALGLFICNVYAQFDDAGDRALSVGFSDITTSGTFYQHPFGSDFPPNDAFIAAFPELAYDTYLTIGLKTIPVGGVNPIAGDGDFNSGGGQHYTGGWFNSNPNNGAGDPNADGRVLLAQLSVNDGDTITGSMTVFWKDAQSGQAIGTAVDFVHVPAPGALALLGVAGLAGRRRRRA